MKRFLATAGLLLTLAAPAYASTIPLLDLPPGTKTATLGLSTATVHTSVDVTGWGWASGYSFGLAGGVDWHAINGRDTNSMVAVRVGKRLWGDWPFSLGLLLSGGLNIVDGSLPLPNATSQRFNGRTLPWFQPAIVLSTALDFDRKLWVRGTFGPVLGRFTEGSLLMPWLVPNVEAAYRFTPAWEAVFGGGYASPVGLSLRAAF